MFEAENTLGVCLLRVVFVAMVLLRKGQAVDSDEDTEKEICSSPECVHMGNTILKNMNQKVHPCEDFYTYACGNWEKYNSKPDDALQWSVHTLMEKKADIKTKELLLSILRRSVIGKIYRVCLDKPSLAKSKPSVIKSYVRNSKYWPMILDEEQAKSLYQPWWKIDNYYIQLTGESAFFDSELMPNVKSGDPPMQNIYELKSAYGSLYRYREWDQESMANYKKFLMKLVMMVSPFKVQEAPILKNLEKVMKFRSKLEKIIIDTEDDDSVSFSPRSIEQFREWYDNSRKKSVTVNWLEIIRSLYGPKHDSKINSNTKINIGRVKYFYSFLNLVEKESEDTIANHIQLYFVERYIKLDSSLKGILLKTTIQNSEPAGWIRDVPERWKSCLDKLDTGYETATAYVDAVFKPKNIKDEVEKLFSKMKDIVKMQISESTWLDSNTKERSIDKVTKSKLWCGYPEWFDKFPLKQKHRDVEMYPTIVNAHLMRHHNLILINAAIFECPIYCKYSPYVMNYATLGSLMAHELYHGFDEKGVSYNAEGKHVKTFLSKKMLKQYEARKQCFVDQYDSYDITELGNTPRPLKCDGEFTFNENLADTMGLKAAFTLYKQKKLKRKGACTVLAGFEKYSCDQFFFLSFANYMCGVVKEEFLLHYLQSSMHAMPRLRVNGAVSNMEEFSAAYECGPQTPMNRTIKCDLWK